MSPLNIYLSSEDGLCPKYVASILQLSGWFVRDLNKKNGQMRMTAENLDSEVSQVVKNTRKLTVLHKREKSKTAS